MLDLTGDVDINEVNLKLANAILMKTSVTSQENLKCPKNLVQT